MAGNEYEYRIGDEWDGIEIPEWAERERALREKLREREWTLLKMTAELDKLREEYRQLIEKIRIRRESLLRSGVNLDDILNDILDDPIPDSPS